MEKRLTGNRMFMEMCKDSLDVRREESWFHIVRLLSVPIARLSLHPHPDPPEKTEGIKCQFSWLCWDCAVSLYIARIPVPNLGNSAQKFFPYISRRILL